MKRWQRLVVFFLIGLTIGQMLVWGMRALDAHPMAETQAELEICLNSSYSWRAEYANTVYCIRIDDGRLVGVPLEEVEVGR